jgi:hypothetical protein
MTFLLPKHYKIAMEWPIDLLQDLRGHRSNAVIACGSEVPSIFCASFSPRRAKKTRQRSKSSALPKAQTLTA